MRAGQTPRMSQEDLALKVGVNRMTISSIERGLTTPSLKLARQLAHVLGFSLDTLE